MWDSTDTAELVLRYFESWQQADWEGLRACLADEVDLDWGDDS